MKNDQLIETLGAASCAATNTKALIKFIKLTLKARKFTLSMDAYDKYNEVLPFAIDTLCRVIEEDQNKINSNIKEAINSIIDMEETETKKL